MYKKIFKMRYYFQKFAVSHLITSNSPQACRRYNIFNDEVAIIVIMPNTSDND